MEVLFTQHAKSRMKLRGIKREWVLSGLKHPVHITRHPNDSELMIYYSWVTARSRWLKMIIKVSGSRLTVVTTHFDHTYKGIVP